LRFLILLKSSLPAESFDEWIKRKTRHRTGVPQSIPFDRNICGLVARLVIPKYNPRHAPSVEFNCRGGKREKAFMSVQKKTLLGQKKTKNAKAAKGKLDAKTIKSASKEINLTRAGGSKLKYL
jgi:hypothetical protein